jgi:hypothetical protein
VIPLRAPVFIEYAPPTDVWVKGIMARRRNRSVCPKTRKIQAGILPIPFENDRRMIEEKYSLYHGDRWAGGTEGRAQIL